MNTTSLEYHRGDIFYANLEPHLGCEQGGIRPVLVLQNNVGNKHSKTLIVSALTSRTASKAKLPTHVFLDYIPGMQTSKLVSYGSTVFSETTWYARVSPRAWR